MPAERDNRKIGQSTLTDYHKVKVIFVGKCMSVLGGFTAVLIAFEIWIILDRSYNYITVDRKK